MRRRTLVLLVLVHAFVYQRAQEGADSSACCAKSCFECCRPDAFAPAGIMTDHVHPRGEFSCAYGVMFMNMNGNMRGSASQTDADVFQTYMVAPHNMNMQMHMLMPMYGITNRLTAMAMIGYTTNKMTMRMKPDEGMTGMPAMNTMPSEISTAGITDTKIYLLYNLLGDCMHRLVASAGVSFPTGNISVKGPTLQNNNDVLSYNMQLGSGTYDFLPGLVYIGQTDHFTFGAATNAIVRTSMNARGYRLGNEYSFSPWLAYKFMNWGSFSLRSEGYLQEGIKGYDAQINQSSLNDPTANVMNSGRTKVSLLAGFNLYLSGKHLNDTRVLLEYGMPLWQSVNGTQIASHSIINLRIQYSFIKS